MKLSHKLLPHKVTFFSPPFSLQYTDKIIGSFGIMLDLVETIGRLLVHSERNQTEFRNIDGYTFFINLFAALSEDEFATPGMVRGEG